jgi:glycine/D-amino acid oxidase-like deaminating enzyme
MTAEELAQVPDRVEVAVVGLGLMGTAAAWALARRGHQVVAFDAHTPGHRFGSSHGSSRIFRRAYPEPEYVAMTGQALELWRELERATGTTLLVTTGGLDHGRDRDVRRLSEALRAGGAPCTLLTPAEAVARWPHLRFEGTVLYHPQAGVIDPEVVMAETSRLASSHGARLLREAPVDSVASRPDGGVVGLAGRTVHADTVVVAAGPWTPVLLDRVVALPPLTVTQQPVFYYARRDARDDSSWPTVLHDAARQVYGLSGGRDGGTPGAMKLGEHAAGRATSAARRDGLIDPATRRRMSDYVRRFWPGLDPRPVAERDCLYTWTPSQDFLVARYGALVVCSACSGHAAKFTPLIGEWLADLVERRPLPAAARLHRAYAAS